MAKAAGKKAKAKPKKTLTPEQKHALDKRNFARRVRVTFERMGFHRVAELADTEIEFGGRVGDFDDALVYENIILLLEYTVSNPSQVGDHVKGKAHLFSKIDQNRSGFLTYLTGKFPPLAERLKKYHPSQVRVRIIYCSKSEIKPEHQELSPSTSFLWHGSIRYFSELSAAIKRSARFELFDYLKLPHQEVGIDGILQEGAPKVSFPGSILPEAHSNFPPGFKVISFYVSPGAVLSRAYVLRKDGWRDSQGLYQRMIQRSKVESIRRYLRTNERVFVNNVILTLPDETKLLFEDGSEVKPAEIEKTQPIIVELPGTGNSVGIVDGQHRIFSYYEDAQEDPKIDLYRGRQNLLATGIMYPKGYSALDRERFEARLFLEINSTQNAAKSGLKQAIALIVQPFSPDSIGKRVTQHLSGSGPLEGLLERNFYDVGVLRTTTIVSYGLRSLVRLDGTESLIQHWPETEKRAAIEDHKDEVALAEYAAFAAKEISKFLSAARAVVGSQRWALQSKDGPGLLTVTFVNGLLVLFRQYVKEAGLQSFDKYRADLTPLATFDFKAYKSSRYTAMGGFMFKEVFGKSPT